MKNRLSLLIIFFQLTQLVVWANNIDTGWIKFKQPDGTEFIGRSWGDEFEFYSETQDGFRFVKNYRTGYWCYATLASQGNFEPTKLKVGIDDPVKYGLIKELSFAGHQQELIEQKRKEFAKELTKIREEMAKNKQPLMTTRNIWVDLVLVEFQDVRHDPAYTNQHFNTMFASNDVYEGTIIHPDGKPVFGSVRDYWEEMTFNDVIITGAVWNPAGWILLDYDKIHYDTTDAFVNDVNIKSGYPLGDLNSNHLRAYIYAGNEYAEGSGLHPRLIPNGYMMAAEFSRPQGPGSDDWQTNFLGNIGTHCHELGHAAFGLGDRYYAPGDFNHWGLMAIGNENGPLDECACPATLNPYDRQQEGWLSIIPFSGIEFNKSFQYNYYSPQVYQVQVRSNEFFLIENRQSWCNATDTFDEYLPWHPDEGGLLVWHKRSTGVLDLIEADNSNSEGVGEQGDQFPGTTDNRFLNDFTSPNVKLTNGTNSQITIHNISDAGITMYADLGIGWFGNIPYSLTWQNNIEIGGDVTVPADTTLTIATGAVVNLNGHTLHISGNGNIIRQAGVTVNPDIQLLSGSTLKGQYPTLASAFADAQSGDEIHLASDDTLHTAWEIPTGITFKVTNEASLVLEGDLDVADGATFVVDEHTYIKCYDHIDIQGGTMEVSLGTRLEFDHYRKIKVKGILNAEGTASDRIVFTSHNGDWTGICFYEEC